MARETTPDVIALEAAKDAVHSFETPKSRQLAKIGLIAGLLAVTATAATARPNNALAHPDSQANYPAQTKEIGVVTDMAEQLDRSAADQAITFIKNSGFTALKETVQIATGQQGFLDMSIADQTKINNSLDAAAAQGISVNLYLWAQSYVKGIQPPVMPYQERGFCRVGAQIIQTHPGVVSAVSVNVEPNNPKFRHRQFNQDGSDAASGSAEQLLSICYDIIKPVDPSVSIVGLELAPGGNDNPLSKRPSHSPLSFIKDVCMAYRNSGRTKPIMDEASIHWYPVAHSNNQSVTSVMDYDKVESALNCFKETGQPVPPISWGEGGDPVAVPIEKIARYGGIQPPGSRPGHPIDQGNYVE